MASIDPADIQAFASVFARTLTEDVKQATEDLRVLQTQRPDFLVVALAAAECEDLPQHIRQSASIFAKNYVYEYWNTEIDNDDNVQIPDDVREYVRSAIIPLTCECTNNQRLQQYENILGLIAHADYPAKWPTFVAEIVNQLSTTDIQQSARTLNAMHVVFYHYQTEEDSNELRKELIEVQLVLFEPLLKVFETWVGAIEQAVSENNQALLESCLNIAKSTYEILYSMSNKDIPAFVEDNIANFVNPGLAIAGIPTKALYPDDDFEPTALEKAQTAFFSLMRLFAANYEANVESFIEGLVGAAFETLTTRPDSSRYDELVICGVNFLSSLARNIMYKGYFTQDNLAALCERVIIPQIQLRETDVEMFEDNGPVYVNMDLFGSDSGTRRRCASDFIRALCKYFEKEVSEILRASVEELLQSYASNPAENWRFKDAAIYIVLAMSVRGSDTAEGDVDLNEYVDVGAFFDTHIMPEISTDPENVNPIIRSNCIKFLIQFRSLMPSPCDIMMLLLSAVESESYVIRTYGAVAVDRYLSVLDSATRQPRISKEEVLQHSEVILKKLTDAIEGHSVENEHIAKALLRFCQRAKDGLGNYADVLLEFAVIRLTAIAENPRIPAFAHAMFEIVAASIKATDQARLENFANQLMPILQDILSNENCADFHQYAIQIIAVIVESYPPVLEYVMSQISSFLDVSLWEGGKAAALTRLIAAAIAQGGNFDGESVKSLIAIIKFTNTKISLFTTSFKLATIVFSMLPSELVFPHLSEFIMVIFRRLSAQPKPEYCDQVLVFWSNMVVTFGAENFLASLSESHERGVLMSLKFFIRTLKTLYTPLQKRITLTAAVLLAVTLSQAEDATLKEISGEMAQSAVLLAAVAESVSTNVARFTEDEFTIRDEEEKRILSTLAEEKEKQYEIESHAVSYEAGYSPLRFAPEPQYPQLQKAASVKESLQVLGEGLGESAADILGPQLTHLYSELVQ